MGNGETISEEFIEQLQADFREAMEALVEGVGDQYALEQLPLDNGLEWTGEEPEIALLGGIVKQELGVDISSPPEKDLIRDGIRVEGVAGQPSEGGGTARVYATTREEIYLRIVQYRSPNLGTRYDFITNPDIQI